MVDIRDARRLFSIGDVLGDNSPILLCPFPDHPHSSMTPSLSVFWDGGVEKFKCHGVCGRQGDVIDLVGHLEIQNYDDKKIEHIERAVALLRDGFKPRQHAPPKKLALPPNKYMEYLPPSSKIIDYALSRGLTLDTLNKFHIGARGNAMAMPFFMFGVLLGIKFRSLGTGLRYFSEKGSRMGVFNYDAINYKDEPILFLKAEIPCMLADQYGFTACGLTGGEGCSIEPYYHAFRFSERVVYVTDNDANPKTREQMLAKAVERMLPIGGYVFSPPGKYKDWDEWLLDDEEDCLLTTRRWLNV